MGEGYANVTLYLGLRESPARLGFRGENHWTYSGFDHDEAASRRDELLHGRAHAHYLSFPSLKDPAARAHTAEVIAPVSYQAFARWQAGAWRARGEEYEALKQRVSEALLASVEAHHPGFRALVAFQELSTPLTSEHFTGHAQGAIYGLPAVPERYRLRWLGPRTPLPGLLLVGADAASLGIVGALMGGVLGAAVALGSAGYPEIMKAARRARSADRPAPQDEPGARAA